MRLNHDELWYLRRGNLLHGQLIEHEHALLSPHSFVGATIECNQEDSGRHTKALQRCE